MLLVLPPRTRKVLVPNAKALHTKPMIASPLSAHTVPDISILRTSVGPTQLPLVIRGQSGPRSFGLRLERLLLGLLVLLLARRRSRWRRQSRNSSTASSPTSTFSTFSLAFSTPSLDSTSSFPLRLVTFTSFPEVLWINVVSPR